MLSEWKIVQMLNKLLFWGESELESSVFKHPRIFQYLGFIGQYLTPYFQTVKTKKYMPYIDDMSLNLVF